MVLSIFTDIYSEYMYVFRDLTVFSCSEKRLDDNVSLMKSFSRLFQRLSLGSGKSGALRMSPVCSHQLVI